jgi:hypothetical protein
MSGRRGGGRKKRWRVGTVEAARERSVKRRERVGRQQYPLFGKRGGRKVLGRVKNAEKVPNDLDEEGNKDGRRDEGTRRVSRESSMLVLAQGD